MEKNKILFFSLVFFTGLLSCKKEDERKTDLGTGKSKKLDNLLVDNTYKAGYEVGGTIGCTIRFTDKNSSKYGDNDAYDQCYNDQTHKDPTFPAGSGNGHVLVPPAPDVGTPLEDLEQMQDRLMTYYWELFGVAEPQSYNEFAFIRSKLAVYNAVITSVFTDVMGNLVIPEDRLTRRTMLQNYNGVLPDGIIQYADFVYGEHFFMKLKVACHLYSSDPAANEFTEIYSYGVKTFIGFFHG